MTLNISCRVCGKLDSHCFSQVPVPPDHIQWIRENTVYDGRLLSECKTHEDRRSMGHLYTAGASRIWNRVVYDDDGIEMSGLSPDDPWYRRWLRTFRRSDRQPIRTPQPYSL